MVNNAVNNAVKGVHEMYAGQIATLKAQIGAKDKGKGKMIELEQVPLPTTFPEINPRLATSSSQEIASSISRLEEKIDSLRAEMHGNLTVIMNSIMYKNFQTQTLETTSQTMTDTLKRKCNDRDTPVRRARKIHKKVRLDTSATTGTSAGAGPSSTHAGTHDNVAISTDRDSGDGGREPQRNSELVLEDLEKYFNVPLEETAKALNISSTGLKIKSRELGIGGWPYRKLHSLQKLIENRKVIT